jgi:hypothetical protein
MMVNRAGAVSPMGDILAKEVRVVARNEFNFCPVAMYACQVMGEAQSFDAVRDNEVTHEPSAVFLAV